MIKHLIKLIWNRKKSTMLLMVEVFLSFLVIFAISTAVFSELSNYNDPKGFNHKNLWIVQYQWEPDSLQMAKEKIRQIELSLKNFSEIENFTFTPSYNTPYTQSAMTTGIDKDDGTRINFNVFNTDDSFLDVTEIKLTEGRWFNKSDDAESDVANIIVNKTFAQKYFGDKPAAGEYISEGKGKRKCIGVVESYKYQGEFSENRPAMFYRQTIADIDDDYKPDYILLRVKPGTPPEFEEKIVQHISSLTKGWLVNLRRTEETREVYIEDKLFSMAVPAFIGGFLIINVALGLMGVLWYSINRRKPEIGLRKASGASGAKITGQIIAEAIILGTFSIAGGVFLAFQAPLLELFNISTVIFTAGIIAAAIFLYLIISFCAFYPGILAARIAPADALHDD